MNSKYRVEFPDKLKHLLEMVFYIKRQPKHFGVELLPIGSEGPCYLFVALRVPANSTIEKPLLSFQNAHRLR